MSKIIDLLKKSKIVEGLGLAGTIVGGLTAIAGLGSAAYGLYATYFANPVYSSTICLNEYDTDCFARNRAFEKRLSDTAFGRADLLKIAADFMEAPFLDDRPCAFPFESDSPYRFELPLDADCLQRAFIEFDPSFWNDVTTLHYGGGTIRTLKGKFEVGAITDFIWAEDQPTASSAFLYQLRFIGRLD